MSDAESPTSSPISSDEMGDRAVRGDERCGDGGGVAAANEGDASALRIDVAGLVNRAAVEVCARHVEGILDKPASA